MESVAISMDKEAFKASIKFEAVFNFSKMDTMIHRFPAGLREIINSKYPYMVVPKFVAIGPYHHKNEQLKNMEVVKKAAVRFLGQRSQRLKKAIKKAAAARYKRSESSEKPDQEVADAQEVVDAVDEARGMYTDETLMEEGSMTKDHAQFADMMICDACFLLMYMHAYIGSYSKDEGDDLVNESMRRFLFCNRDCINNDIMLLENQLPWPVIQVLMNLASSKLKLKETVGYFIAAMGNSFKVRESSNLKPYDQWDNNNPPPHLLALLRRHSTEEPDKTHSACTTAELGLGTSTSVDVLSDGGVENNNNHPPPPSNSLHFTLISQEAPTPPPPPPPPSQQISSEKKPSQQAVVVSAISPMDLEQIGIKLTADPKAKFSDMGLEEGWLRSHVKLAPLSLDDTGASWLVNMAAFEVRTASRFGDPPGRTAVCSYLKLLAFFMVGSDDVRKLRSRGLLRGPNRDDDMLAFFETFKKHLSDYGTHFALVMKDVEEYQQKRRIWTTLYRWVYKYWKTVGAVLSIIIPVATAIATLIQLYQALLSLINNN